MFLNTYMVCHVTFKGSKISLSSYTSSVITELDVSALKNNCPQIANIPLLKDSQLNKRQQFNISLSLLLLYLALFSLGVYFSQ